MHEMLTISSDLGAAPADMLRLVQYGFRSAAEVLKRHLGTSERVRAFLMSTPTPALQAYLYAGREQQSQTLYEYGTAKVGPTTSAWAPPR